MLFLGEVHGRTVVARVSSRRELTATRECIPFWDAFRYHEGVTTQIAVRLPDPMVAFLDASVADGKAPSRAALVAAAVERQMRWQAALQDAETLRTVGTADDLDDLVSWSVAHARLEP